MSHFRSQDLTKILRRKTLKYIPFANHKSRGQEILKDKCFRLNIFYCRVFLLCNTAYQRFFDTTLNSQKLYFELPKGPAPSSCVSVGFVQKAKHYMHTNKEYVIVTLHV